MPRHFSPGFDPGMGSWNSTSASPTHYTLVTLIVFCFLFKLESFIGLNDHHEPIFDAINFHFINTGVFNGSSNLRPYFFVVLLILFD